MTRADVARIDCLMTDLVHASRAGVRGPEIDLLFAAVHAELAQLDLELSLTARVNELIAIGATR